MVVNDSHWQMRNLRAEDLHARARLIIGDKPFSMTQGIGGIGRRRVRCVPRSSATTPAPATRPG